MLNYVKKVISEDENNKIIIFSQFTKNLIKISTLL
jgi:hypothetical protein